MKQTAILLCLLVLTVAAMSQTSTGKPPIEPPRYDTTSMDIVSTNSFYFCSQLFSIPRDCENRKDPRNCCSFNTQASKYLKPMESGQIGCYDGTTLMWNYCTQEYSAKNQVESSLKQREAQVKTFKKEKIDFYICGKKAEAFKVTQINFQNYKHTEIMFYSTIDGQSFFAELHLPPERTVNSSKDLTEFFQQLVRF